MNRELALNISPDTVVTPLSGGITNINFRLHREPFSPDEVLTILPDRDTWWRIKKDYLIEDILSTIDVPHSRKIANGIALVEGRYVAFLKKSFIDGPTFDEFFEGNPNNLVAERLMFQLGEALGRMHGVRFDKFGFIRPKYIAGSEYRRNVSGFNSWEEFMDMLMTEREETLNTIPRDRDIGGITGQDLINVFPKIGEFYSRNRTPLSSVKSPFLTHNDMRFGNIIVSGDENLGGIIDLEACLAGDPEMDIVQIDNWLEFTKYKDRVLSYRDSFKKGYMKYREISGDYEAKRKIYFMIRSLSYLLAVMSLPENSELFSQPTTEGYFKKHFELLMETIETTINKEGIIESEEK